MKYTLPRPFRVIAEPPQTIVIDMKSPGQTFRLLLFILADLFGTVCVVLGASFFVTGRAALLPGFPIAADQAGASLLGGLAVIAWAVWHLLRELKSPRR